MCVMTTVGEQVWDHRFHIDETPHYSPMSDPHCTTLTYPWTVLHQGICRQERPRSLSLSE